MVRLPVWELGLIILAPMSVAYAIRGALEARFVDSLPTLRRAVAQFYLELVLYIFSGLVMALILLTIYNFPLLQSGFKLVLGVVTVGFFAAMDISLMRERMAIEGESSKTVSYDPPENLFPITRRFTYIAVIILVLVTAIMLLVLIRDVRWLAEQNMSMESIQVIGRSVLIEISFVMIFLLVMVLNLIFSYARNLQILFENQTTVLENVSHGDLSRRVPVATNDELGFIAGHTNTMIRSLREERRMREGLRIAREVQHNFLPSESPQIPGLEVAGIARFSDETGGDFYDYIGCDLPQCQLTAIVVGDVSGHGIGAALLMAAGRALIRQSTESAGAPSQNIGAANRHLVRDMEGSGRFITLFYMVLDPVTRRALWVNAGHQPPLVYDVTTDAFTELRGNDIPIGVEASWVYHEHYMPMPSPDQIVFIGTDGVWEAHNPLGEMFGGERLQQVVRENAARPAHEIMDAVVEAVTDFTGHATQEDDVTLVVLRGVAD